MWVLLRRFARARLDHQGRKRPRAAIAHRSCVASRAVLSQPRADDADGWAKVDPALTDRGHAGNRRLHQQWCRFLERKKNTLVANVAIARELAGWCWSLATLN